MKAKPGDILKLKEGVLSFPEHLEILAIGPEGPHQQVKLINRKTGSKFVVYTETMIMSNYELIVTIEGFEV